MNPSPPIIALLTDFGSKDWFVAAMKAVIFRICPEARVIDITHEVEPGNIKAAAFILSQCYANFPRGTVFLCVVDPGVGSERKSIIHYDGDYNFVTPDNGTLGLLKSGMCRTYEIDPLRIDPHNLPSSTFHGRDLFAPAAAWVAAGRSPNEFADPLPKFAHEGYEFTEVQALPQRGTVIYFDRFGNAISNLKLGKMSPRPQTVRLDDDTQIPFGKTFADVSEGNAIAYLGSGGFVEIAINRGSARISLNLENESDFQIE